MLVSLVNNRGQVLLLDESKIECVREVHGQNNGYVKVDVWGPSKPISIEYITAAEVLDQIQKQLLSQRGVEESFHSDRLREQQAARAAAASGKESAASMVEDSSE